MDISTYQREQCWRSRTGQGLFWAVTLTLLSACDPAGHAPVMMEEAAVSAEAPPPDAEPYTPPVLEPAIVAEEPAAPAKAARPGTLRPRQGVLTAGDIDDTRNLADFQRYMAKAARHTKLPAANLSRPILAQLVGSDGKPAPRVHVTLRKPGAAEPFYQGYSGVDGYVTVFPSVYGVSNLSQVELRAFSGIQGDAAIKTIRTGNARTQISLPFQNSDSAEFLDLVFVVDTTGSMADELNWLTRELRGIVRKAKSSAPGVDIRYGLVVYRDHGDSYVVRNYGFTNQQSQMVSWLRKQKAAGGGDYPEAAADALAAGAALSWRRGKGERLMFHIADAPPHARDSATYLEAAKRAARANVQVFGLGASGVAAESEYLMRQAAVQSSGRYMFLTDDSGVGNSHAEPTISCYQVTHLNDLMLRVLRSELSGHREEAAPGSVIRSVGSYAAGRCLN